MREHCLWPSNFSYKTVGNERVHPPPTYTLLPCTPSVDAPHHRPTRRPPLVRARTFYCRRQPLTVGRAQNIPNRILLFTVTDARACVQNTNRSAWQTLAVLYVLSRRRPVVYYFYLQRINILCVVPKLLTVRPMYSYYTKRIRNQNDGDECVLLASLNIMEIWERTALR